MHRTIAPAALAFALLFSPRPAQAYPDSGAQYAITVKDVSWTVLQDHKDPLLWYCLPAVASIAEPEKRQPGITLLKYQVPAPGGSQELVGNTQLLLTLNLAPGKAELKELAKAVAGLKPMLDRKAAAGDISLESVRLDEVKLSLSDPGGKLLAEAPAIETVGPGLRAGEVYFTVSMQGDTAGTVEKLLLGAAGVKASVDYAYTAGVLKPGAARSGPAVFRGQASGAVSLGAYTKDVQDKSVVIFPAGNPPTAFFQLPAVADSPELAQVTYQVSIVKPDGERSGFVMPEFAMWSAKKGPYWRDQRGNLRQTLLFPIFELYREAEKAGKDISSYKFRVNAEAGTRRGTQLYITKAEGDTAFITGGIPFSPAYSPFRIVSVYGDYLTFTTQDSASDLAYVKLGFSCGKQKKAFTLKADKDGILSMNPVTAFFDKACGSVSLEADYVQRGPGENGRKNRKVFSDLAKDRDSAVYLEDYAD